MGSLQSFFQKQLSVWASAKQRFDELVYVQVKQIGIYQVQHNPARMVSTAAKIDMVTLSKRPCFLCEKNRPQEQITLDFEESYDVLVNPFPILPIHFTISSKKHQLQHIYGNFGDMLQFIKVYDEYMVFYNGPKCGASAPDHLHFQAGKKEVLPIFQKFTQLLATRKKIVTSGDGAELFLITQYPAPFFVITSPYESSSIGLFNRLYNCLPIKEDDTEPMMNIIAWKCDGVYTTLIFPRSKHRPDCYFASVEKQILVSPGAIDMSGMIILPQKTDFEAITESRIEEILAEVSLSENLLMEVSNKLKIEA